MDAVGGMTMGADPIAAAVLHQGAARGLAYDAFVVRKEPKDHGRGKQVEGPDLEGRRVVVLEDTSTTGGSPLGAIAALEKVGAVIAAVAASWSTAAPAPARADRSRRLPLSRGDRVGRISGWNRSGHQRRVRQRVRRRSVAPQPAWQGAAAPVRTPR